MQQQHALVEHTERFEPFDLRLAELDDARIAREVRIARRASATKLSCFAAISFSATMSSSELLFIRETMRSR